MIFPVIFSVYRGIFLHQLYTTAKKSKKEQKKVEQKQAQQQQTQQQQAPQQQSPKQKVYTNSLQCSA